MLSQPIKQQSPTKPQFLIKMKSNNKKCVRLNSISPSYRYRPPFISNPQEQNHSVNLARCKTQGIQKSSLNQDQLYSVRGTSDISAVNTTNNNMAEFSNNFDQSTEDINVSKIRIKKQLKMRKLDFIQKNIFNKIQAQSCNLQSVSGSDIKLQNCNLYQNHCFNLIGVNIGRNAYSNIHANRKRQKNVQNQFLPPIQAPKLKIKQNQIRSSHTPKMVECSDGMITFSPKKNRNSHQINLISSTYNAPVLNANNGANVVQNHNVNLSQQNNHSNESHQSTVYENEFVII